MRQGNNIAGVSVKMIKIVKYPMRSLLFFLRRALFLAASTAILLHSTGAIAAERVVFKYHFLQNSISVSELSTLAETGKVSSSLQTYLNLAKQDPQDIRRTLNQSVNVNPILLDRLLKSPAGDLILDQISQVVSTTGEANRQALRSALVRSATNGQITLIETLENYPSPEVQVDASRLGDAYLQLQRLRDTAQALQDIWQILD